MMELESDLLIKLLFIVGLVFLLWVWSFWKDLEDNDEFHPDGLEQCPPETYTVLKDVSNNSSKVRCFSCPVCLAGEEPSPPCGITLAVKASGECTLCKPGTYSDEVNSAACKICTDCGPRNVMSSCSAEKNTKCEDCPWRHFEDDTTQICKHCSSCCGRNSPAELECFLTKKCRGRCTRTTKTKIKHLSLIFSRLVAKSMNGSYNTTSITSGTNLQKDSQEKSKLLESVIKSKQDGLTRSDTKRDVRAQDVAQGNYKDSSDGQTTEKVIDRKELEDLEFLEIPDILKNVQEQADILGTKQDPSPTKNNLEDTNTHSVENKEPTVQSQKFSDKNRFTFQQTMSAPTTAGSELGQLTPHNSMTMASTTQTQLINPSSFLSSFTGTIVAVLILGLIGLIIYAAFKKCHKIPKGYRKLSGTSKPKELQREDDPFDEFSDKEDKEFSGDETITNEPLDKNVAVTILEDLNLSEIPPDLEDILVMSLDVPHKAESKVYGWQKVGNAAEISQRELKYYGHLGGKNESPTKLLLEKLGSQGRTISYLIDVLQKPSVELGSVAKTIIRHRVTRL
ncbi:uncharacterized protein LOC144642702 [Oculina patagonica]